MSFDVTLLSEQLITPILSSFGVVVIDVLKTVSNEQFKSVDVHVKKEEKLLRNE